MLERKLRNLHPNNPQILRNMRRSTPPHLVELNLKRINRHPQRRRPPPQRMHHSPQRRQRINRRLPPRSSSDTPNRPPIEIDPLIPTQILDIIERVLHQPRDSPVVPGRGQNNPISLPQRLYQILGRVRPLGNRRIIERQHQISPGQYGRPSPSLSRPGQRNMQRPLRLRADPQRPPNTYHRNSHTPILPLDRTTVRPSPRWRSTAESASTCGGRHPTRPGQADMGAPGPCSRAVTVHTRRMWSSARREPREMQSPGGMTSRSGAHPGLFESNFSRFGRSR